MSSTSYVTPFAVYYDGIVVVKRCQEKVTLPSSGFALEATPRALVCSNVSLLAGQSNNPDSLMLQFVYC